MELNGIFLNRVIIFLVVEKIIVIEKKNVDVDEFWFEIIVEVWLELEKEFVFVLYFYLLVIFYKYGYFWFMFIFEMFKYRNSI